MPKGLKNCNKCGGENGAKAHNCRHCGEAFVIKSRKENIGRVRSQWKKEPTGMSFHPIPLTSSCLKTYDKDTTRICEDSSGNYRIRLATKLKCGTTVVHERPFAALVRRTSKHFITQEVMESWDMIGRYRSIYWADVACKKHSEGKKR